MYTFLVVEDEKHIQEFIVSILQDINGGGIYYAENGLEALKIMDQVKPDAIITDIRMPIKDGISLIKAVYERREKLPVAILSGYDELEYFQAALSYGVVDYILKPIKRNDLVKLYYKMVRRIKSKKMLEKEMEEIENRLDDVKDIYPDVAKATKRSLRTAMRQVERMSNRCFDSMDSGQKQKYIGKVIEELPTPRQMVYYLAFYSHFGMSYYEVIEKHPEILF